VGRDLPVDSNLRPAPNSRARHDRDSRRVHRGRRRAAWQAPLVTPPLRPAPRRPIPYSAHQLLAQRSLGLAGDLGCLFDGDVQRDGGTFPPRLGVPGEAVGCCRPLSRSPSRAQVCRDCRRPNQLQGKLGALKQCAETYPSIVICDRLPTPARAMIAIADKYIEVAVEQHGERHS